MSPIPLICAQCGAPLPLPVGGSTRLTCGYCGVISVLDGAQPAVVRTGAPAAEQPLDHWERAAFEAQFARSLEGGMEVFEALRLCARSHFQALGESDVLARVTLAIVEDFEQQTGVSAGRNPAVFCRVVEAYVRALHEIRATGQAEINLPYLIETPDGPKHLQRMLGPEVLALLAARDPAARPVAAASPPKKSWWPFA